MKTRIALIAAFLVVGVIHLHAATIPVTSTADSGTGSLREALASAANGDTIDATGVSGTILLTSGELLVSNSVTILGPGPANLAVNGNAASRVFYIGSNTVVSISSLTISNGFVSGAFGGGIYNDHATLTVSNSTLSGNSAYAVLSFFGFFGGNGGGIYNEGHDGSATVTIANSTVSGNSAGEGGGIYNDGEYGSATLTVSNSTVSGNSGGGIYNDGGFYGSATVTIANSTVSGNSAGEGGGIYNYGENYGSATVTIANSTLSGNSAGFYGGGGGGIVNDGSNAGSATLTIANSTLSGNSAPNGYGYGGGIYNYGEGGSATLTIADSTLSGNAAPAGGGIENYGYEGSATLTIANSALSGNSAGEGGGIENYGSFGSATLTVSNCTLSGNSATGDGGGIENAFGTLTIANSTLSGNSATYGGGIYNNYDGTLEIGSTILNADASGGNISNSLGSVTSLGYNLSSDGGGGFLTATGDLINTDPMLGPLQDNGGPTFTHALLCGSPAIDKGKNFSDSAADQRGVGFARTFDDPSVPNATGGDGTDIGAFERQTVCNNPPVALCRNVTVSAGSDCIANASIDNGSFDPDAGDTITLTQSPAGPYGLGVTTVTLTVTDNHGASNNCTATVTVVDTTPPQITCPANIVTDATSPAGAVVSFAPTASDNCLLASVTSTPPSGSTFAIGTTTVTCRAIDAAGLTNSCTFTIRVNGAADADGDGVPDAIDQCPNTPRGVIVNSTGCSIAQLAPCDGPHSGGTWKSHGQYVQAVIQAATDFLKAKSITRRQWVEIVTRAAGSRCGWNRRFDHDGDWDWHRNWDSDHDANWGRDRDWGRD